MPSLSHNAPATKNQNKGGNFSSGDHRTQQLLARKQLIAKQRKSLPIAEVEKRLVEEVRKNDTLIIVGETGSGKTTQLPQFLFNAGLCQDGKLIGITQPRRVAAITVAKRVAEECNVELGQKVGYAIRFEDVTSSSTKIKYMTDGLLVREALLDPFLSRYCIIIVDEAHERTVHTDVLLGLLKRVQRARSLSIAKGQIHDNANTKKLVTSGNEDNSKSVSMSKACQNAKLIPLKLIVMSASLDARGFSEYFDGAKAVHIQGRQHPVYILYTYHSEPDYLEATLTTIFQVHLGDGPGDILAFLTGQEEIESIERLVHERSRQLSEDSLKILTVPIYSALPSEQQMNVFKPAPSGSRKVILATNIAETSVTIPGVKYVIDPGLVKARSFNPVTGMESLIITPTSKAQALQRSGRAGREGPGKCFRLYPESEFGKLMDSTVPEIKRCNLSNVVLQLKALGIDDIIGFDFMEKPSRTSIVKALEQLFLLGALTAECKLTDPVGLKMYRLPLDPIYSKALLVADEFKCLEEMLIVVAMLSVESIFYVPREKFEEATSAKKSFSSAEGDHITLVNVYRASAECLEKSKAANSKETGDPQRIKRIAAAAYEYENDRRWAEYWNNVLIPPHLASRSDVVDHFKRKFYQRFIDPDLVVEAMTSTSSSQSARASSRSTAAPATESARSRTTASNTGTQPPRGNSNALRLDKQTIHFSTNAWVLVVAMLGVLPVVPITLSNKAYKLSLMGMALSSFYSLYTLYGKPRAWSLPAIQTWFQSIFATKDFIHFVYCLMLVSSQMHFKFALVPVLCWALEHVAKFLRGNFSRSTFYRKYLEEPCVWVESNITTLSILSSHAEIALGFLLILSLFSWQRNILQTFMYWQLLKLMYHAPAVAGYHQSVWARINRTISPCIHTYAPFLKTPLSAIQRWWFR